MTLSADKTMLRIGSRKSPLALTQVEEVLLLLKDKGVKFSYRLTPFVTKGDKDTKTPLSTSPADDFFTDTLDAALLENKIDVAVHSAKDLPQDLNEKLDVFALTPSLDETDAFVGKVKLSQLKPGAKVGTSSHLRRQSILSINSRIKTVDIRGNIQQRLGLMERRKVDGIIVATCALKRLGLSHLIQDILPYEPTPLQGQLAIVGRRRDLRLRKVFDVIDVRKTYGEVILTGAGPGDPELVTVKAIKALESADAVFYDYLMDERLLEYARKAEKIYVGKRKGEHVLAQSELCKMLRQKAMEGKTVVRLKGGDPLVFGRGADEINYLRAYYINVRVIPGVSSATGVPSSLGIPLTARGKSSSVAFISGHGEDEKGKPQPVKIPAADTVVFLMGLTKLSAIIRALRKNAWSEKTPMIIISKGTRRDEKIVCGQVGTIEKLAKKEQLEPPALMVAGETVSFWKKKHIQDSVLYLGTNPDKYKMLGHLIHIPVIEISKAPISAQQQNHLKTKLAQYDLLLFTSRYGIEYFMETLEEIGIETVRLRNIDVAVIGKFTEGIVRRYGFEPKVVAQTETSEGFLKALKDAYPLKGKRILFPRSSLPNPYLKRELTKLGAQVTELTVYDNKKPQKKDFNFERINKVVFTSPSTVKNFLSDYGPIPRGWQILSKGPLTSRALKEAGYKSEVLVYE